MQLVSLLDSGFVLVSFFFFCGLAKRAILKPHSHMSPFRVMLHRFPLEGIMSCVTDIQEVSGKLTPEASHLKNVTGN